MNELTNKWALVTGASRGIGLRIATALAAEGCNLILHSRDKSHTQNLMTQLSCHDIQIHSVAAELNSVEQIASLIENVRKIHEELDILYNNAAIMTPYQHVFSPSVSEYQTSFMVNSIAPIKLCDAFIPGMLDRGWGRIVNVTSGIANEPELMPYSCSKAALDRYVRDMTPTLDGTNVLMNLLDPGWLRTDLGGPNADHDPDSVVPGVLVPLLLDEQAGSGKLYRAQQYRKDNVNPL